MKYLWIFTLLGLYSSAYGAFTVHQMICPAGYHQEVTTSGKWVTDKKTGKKVFAQNTGRPISKCVKDGIEKNPKHKKKRKKKKPEKTGPYTIHIFQYGSPSGMGQTYASRQECEAQRSHLSEANKGLDYTYTCVKQ